MSTPLVPFFHQSLTHRFAELWALKTGPNFEADLKIFLDATVEERARRRYLECILRGEEISYEDLLRSMRHRDRLDSTRDFAPLKAAEDAVIIDTTTMTIEEVVQQIMDLIGERI